MPLATLRLSLVEELRLRNGLNDAQRAAPDRLNWGYSEIAIARLTESEPEAGDHSRNHVLQLLWEGGRRSLEVRFGTLDLVRD
ncbi:MAG TPA: hypothetical protein VJ887_04885 [Actinomycetota bacterium]|nr:hypothetical protein [Actinomycetota bacterium]